MDQNWPLVGRSDEVAVLSDLVRSGDRQAVVLAGAPGVGKTRLARESLALARRCGFVVSVATASGSASHIPFGALAPLLGGLDRTATEPDDRAAFLRRAAAALLRGAGGRPFLLFVDDAHRLDPDSATLIHQLVHRRAATVIATVVAGAEMPDAVIALWKDEPGVRLDISPLSSSDTEELVRAVLPGPVEGATAVRFAEVSHGNALYLRELLEGSLADGSLACSDGLWRLTGGVMPSGRLVELIEARFRSLTADQRAALEVIAFAQTLSPAMLAQVVGLPAAAALERHGLVIAENDNGNPTIRLAHPLYLEVVRAGTPALLAAGMAGRLADAIEQVGVSCDEDVLRLATWRLDSGAVADGDLLLRAARIARWRYDFPLAERLARAAAAAGAGPAAAVILAQAVNLQGDSEDGDRLLADLAGADSEDQRYLEAMLNRIESAAFFRGDQDTAARLADEARERLAGTPYEVELATRTVALTFAVHGAGAARDTAVTLFGQITGESAVMVNMVAARSCAVMGEVDTAIELALAGHRVNSALPARSQWQPGYHITQQCDALNFAGRFAECEAISLAHYRDALRERNPDTQAMFAMQLAKSVPERGRADEAARYAREAVQLFTDLGRTQFRQWALEFLAVATAIQGRADEAAAALRELDGLGLPFGHIMAAELAEARAWTLVAAGNIPDACTVLREYAGVAAVSVDRMGEAAVLHDLARLGDPKSAAARIAELAGLVEGELVGVRSAHVAALVDSDAQELESVSQRFEELGATLLAAEAAADAAAAWRRTGHLRQADASGIRAGLLAERCGNPRTPALSRSGAAAALTAAERTVATRVAAGCTNRAVAEELQISVRTVETHLQRVYTKLNIRRRAELAAALGLPAQETGDTSPGMRSASSA